jgi:hypothetical protein
MKSTTFTILFIICSASLAAQTETFDLVTYSAPRDWAKNVTNNSISYTRVNEKDNTWCQIGIMKSTVSRGGVEADFESEWQDLIVRNYKPTGSRQLNEVEEKDGWKIKTGVVNFSFNNSDAIAMLATMSGNQRCISIVASTNSQDYMGDISALLSSVVLEKLVAGSASVPGTPVQTTNSTSTVVGTWGISLVVPYRMGTEGTAGYNIKQYTFNDDGTYTFYAKIFTYRYDRLLLVRESGAYQLSGNTITINPQKSVLEAWSKKDDTDKWGLLVSTEPRALEKLTYQFTKHYYSGVQEWNLVLQANAITNRDGQFSNSPTFSNAWLYAPVSDNAVINLPN